MNIIDVTSQIPSGNYSIGRVDKNTGKVYRPKGFCCHITGDTNPGQAVDWFKNPASGVSANYVIEKNGDLVMCVKPENKAYHCGIVKAPSAQIYFDMGEVNPNLYLIGIECVSAGEPLTDAQWETLLWVIDRDSNTFSITKDRYHIIGHYQLDAITRMDDPVASYSVDVVVDKDLAGKHLTCYELLVKFATAPDLWSKSIDAAVNTSKATTNLGSLEIFAFLPQLIENIGNSKEAIAGLKYDAILQKCTTNPTGWKTAIDTAVAAAKADGSIGDFEVFQYLPLLLEKIAAGK